MKKTKTILRITVAIWGLCWLPFHSHTSFADDLSLISGIYKSEDVDNGVESSELSVGGRYVMNQNPDYYDLAFYAQGSMAIKSYSGTNSPSNSTDITLEGGARYYFRPITETLIPYGSAGIGLMNKTVVTDSDSTKTETREYNGIIYNASFGLHLTLDDNFFIEFETQLFQSNLFMNEKEEQITTVNGNTTTTKTDERSKTELFGDTQGAFNSTTIGFGMVF